MPNYPKTLQTVSCASLRGTQPPTTASDSWTALTGPGAGPGPGSLCVPGQSLLQTHKKIKKPDYELDEPTDSQECGLLLVLKTKMPCWDLAAFKNYSGHNVGFTGTQTDSEADGQQLPFTLYARPELKGPTC